LDGVRFGRRLVVPDARDAREAQREPAPVRRAALEIGEQHLDDDPRLDVHRRPLLADGDGAEAPGHRAKLGIGEPLERLPDRLEASGLLVARGEVIIAEPPVAASIAAIRRDDDEIDALRALHLEPAPTADAGGVGRVEPLHHHALEPLGDEARVERLGFRRARRNDALDRLDAAADRREALPALAIRAVDHRLVADLEHVEESEADGNLAHETIDVFPAPEPSHELLERKRATGGVDRDDLALEDRRGHAEAVDDEGGHVGQARRQVLKTARIEPALVAATMDLDARAVELLLDAGTAVERR